MIKLFLRLFYRPSSAINAVLKQRLGTFRIVVFLFWVGIIRALLETIWLYSRAGKLAELGSSIASVRWLMLEMLPFVTGNIFTAYFRWTMFGLLVFLAGYFVGGVGRFRDILKVYGIVLGSYVLSPIINFLHLIFKSPFINFNISNILVHPIGIGQIVMGIWSVWIAYLVSRQLHKLPKIPSVLVGLMVPLFDRVAFILSSIIYFSMPFINLLAPKVVNIFAIFLFLLLSVVMIPLFIWLGYAVEHKKGLRN